MNKGTYDPFDQQSQDESREEQAKRLEIEFQEEAADIKWLMSSEKGRRFMWRLLDRAGVFRTSFNPNSMTMALKEGQKTEGLYMLSMIHAACHELYQPMIKEALNNDRKPTDI